MKKILIIGGSGWIATHFLDHPLARDHECVAISRSQLLPNKQARLIQGAATDFAFLSDTIRTERPDVIVNFSGKSMPDDSLAEMVSVNVGITAMILYALKKYEIPSLFLTIGSAAEYGDAKASVITEEVDCQPVSGYGYSKFQQTVITMGMERKMRNPLMVLRPFNLLGREMPDATIGALLWKKALAEKGQSSSTLFYPSMIRDFVDIRDAVEAVWLLLLESKQSGVYNICSGVGYSLETVLANMQASLGYATEVNQDEQFKGKEPPIPRVVGSKEKIVSATDWGLRYELKDSVEFIASV